MKERLILVTGMARGGISLVAGVIERCGAWGGKTVRSIKSDNYGSFENVEIRNTMVRPLLRGMGVDPNGQCPLPDVKDCRNIAKKISPWWKKRFHWIIQQQTYPGDGRPVYFVNAQSCLIWPIWAEAYPEAQWVIVRRKDEEIIESCMNTGYMTGYDTKEGWQRWIDMHKWRFAEMVNQRLDVLQIWPQEMLRGDLTRLRELVDHLGLDWEEADVHDYLAPLLWKEGVFELT